jgi:hypothetical protein
MQDNTIQSVNSEKLVKGVKLLEVLFDEDSRPTKRWLAYQTAARAIPYIKIGGKVFFDPPAVKAALEKKNTVQAR